MHLIIYSSKLSPKVLHVDEMMTDVISKAKINNLKLEVSGLLFYHQGQFLQMIEGSKENLESLMSIIETDERHFDIHRIVDEKVTQRGFQEWNMDSFNLSDNETIETSELEAIISAYRKVVRMESETLVEFLKLLVGKGKYN